MVRTVTAELRARYTDAQHAAGGNDATLLAVAAAWYLAAYTKRHPTEEEPKAERRLSFAWVAIDELCVLKEQNAARPPVREWRRTEQLLHLSLGKALHALHSERAKCQVPGAQPASE